MMMNRKTTVKDTIKKKDLFDFTALLDSIKNVHNELSAQASKAVNVSLTIRNWLIGMYISEYQLNGQGRAKYGEMLLPELPKKEEMQKFIEEKLKEGKS